MNVQVLELLPEITARAGRTDEQREVPAETIAELTEAGVFRMLQPKRYGGHECAPRRFYEVIREIAGACGSTGWVASVLGVHPWQLALFPEPAQDDVWGADPDTLLCSSYSPIGRLTPADGGWSLSGRWSFSSGCAHAGWALLGATAEEGDFLTVLVPAADFTVADTWDTVGLRGTGSNDLVVEDAFVPGHRVLRNREHALLRGPGQEVNDGPLYRLPFGAVFTSAITAPVIGAVSGCFAAYTEEMRHRVRASLGGGRFAEDHYAQVSVARVASEVDAAILQMDRNLDELYATASAGLELPKELRLRARRDQVLGTERALTAIDILFRTAGGNSLRRGNPIERAWRDAHAGSVHVANDVERALAMYGKGIFGIPVEDNLV
ncbi:3-hydroxy-9,10-secoandrosta-1,3,5(10)-triene-9,17-dione monooxygenase oxygenase subunit [Amycolatopsis alba]|uniref:Flavin-dependent monooxygenase n=1 Tax=Amycolatopsis alba DSM 44262 TaxID=1125972 RepID=A0A229R6V8_AMYAL|nr:3-hydroxy-9,10-secoandrosta-1,3,5(10)-triene-9,17-dione monooxygenase oxygenase subunit [Amycolatopsis alba]OXM42403.1 flavin-dependent monooxygenase [Amycolatopsis alba DSM 44262]